MALQIESFRSCLEEKAPDSAMAKVPTVPVSMLMHRSS